jgi:hypothetical protein
MSEWLEPRERQAQICFATTTAGEGIAEDQSHRRILA